MGHVPGRIAILVRKKSDERGRRGRRKSEKSDEREKELRITDYWKGRGLIFFKVFGSRVFTSPIIGEGDEHSRAFLNYWGYEDSHGIHFFGGTSPDYREEDIGDVVPPNKIIGR